MKETAEKYLVQEVTKTEITVSTYYNNDQRIATNEAGKNEGNS